MEKEINFGIGFVTGRSNVCKVINSYYEQIVEQTKRYSKKINVTVFILFDTTYQQTPREEFYNIKPEVHKKIKIVYITPEDIEKEIEELTTKKGIKTEDMEFFLGHGHAKGRNTVMYYAIKNKINYLLFWDDDEYPLAVLKEKGKNEWIKQDNILKHLESMDKENANVTIGYHCGYISPIPYIDFNEKFTEQDLKEFIEVISNDIISWESIKEKMQNNNGVTYAKREIAMGNGAYEIESDGVGKWVAGSTLCLNLNDKDKIPAFYNPPAARGEDTFFSTLLDNSKTVRVPVYHFHDGFLKYTQIMDGVYPQTLRKINVKENNIKNRFLKASIGWIKYKPLLLYIKDKENYKKEINNIEKKLAEILPRLNNLFDDDCFSILIEELKKYDRDVEKHYNEYTRTNKIWNKLKEELQGE